MVWTDPLQEGRVPFAKIPLVVWRWKGEWGWGGVKWGCQGKGGGKDTRNTELEFYFNETFSKSETQNLNFILLKISLSFDHTNFMLDTVLTLSGLEKVIKIFNCGFLVIKISQIDLYLNRDKIPM